MLLGGPVAPYEGHRSGSILAQVMACCLTVPSYYLNQSSINEWEFSEIGHLAFKCWSCKLCYMGPRRTSSQCLPSITWCYKVIIKHVGYSTRIAVIRFVSSVLFHSADANPIFDRCVIAWSRWARRPPLWVAKCVFWDSRDPDSKLRTILWWKSLIMVHFTFSRHKMAAQPFQKNRNNSMGTFGKT